jgi:hypothetical protein
MYCIQSYLELLHRIASLILSVEFVNVDETVHTHILQAHAGNGKLPRTILKSRVTGGDNANLVQPDNFVFAARKRNPISDESSPSVCSTSTGAYQESVLVQTQ